jgi:hypothetical protein
MKSIKVYLVIIGVLALLWLAITPAAALNTYTWQGTSSSYWSDPLNWDPLSPPFPPNDPSTYVVINKAPGANVIINANSQTGGLKLGSGNSLNVFQPSGGVQFRLGSALLPGATATVLNDGTLQVTRGSYTILSADASTVNLNGSGQIVLWGDNFLSGECAFINAGGSTVVNGSGHSITGGGGRLAIVTPGLLNQGAITATHGTLLCQSNITQSASGTMNSTPDNTLELQTQITGGTINPNGGSVLLNGGVSLANLNLGGGQLDTANHTNLYGNIGFSSATVFNVHNGHIVNLYQAGDGTPCTLNNYGTINLTSSGVGAYLAVHNPVTLTGTGSVTMGADSTNQMNGSGSLGQGFTNDSMHTIQGGGTINCSVVNHGKLIINNGTMSLIGMVSGSGAVSVMDNATLYGQPGLQCGNFSMSVLATLNLPTNGSIMDLKGNYTFAQTDPARVNFGNWTLKMSGRGGEQTLEVGCRDDGATASGYTNNFVLPELWVTGADTYASLVDGVNNGHRTGDREALYVTTLQVDPGSTLDLNGLRLYAKRGGVIYRVSAGQGSLYGGGKIINTAAASGSAVNLLLLLN